MYRCYQVSLLQLWQGGKVSDGGVGRAKGDWTHDSFEQ